MNRLFRTLSALVALALAAGPVSADIFVHKEAGIQFDVPKGWKAKPDGDQMTVETLAGDLAIVFWVPPEDTWEKAVDALDEELGKVVKNATFDGDPEESDLNGMPMVEVTGKGTVEGQKVEWGVTAIMARKPLIALAFAAPGAWERNSSGLGSFVRSFKKVN